MQTTSTFATILAFTILGTASWLNPQEVLAKAQERGPKQNLAKPCEDSLASLGFVTWWSLDASGYHPAILVKVQNVSGDDLSGQDIRFQGRFTDLRNGDTTVGRTEVKQEFADRKVIYVMLKGRHAFELSQDVNEWPRLECKVMCRVGEVGDEGTQTLLIHNVDTTTMSDEDAFYKINRMPDIRH